MENKFRGYFQPQQAQEVAAAFAKHNVEYMFIGKSGAILLGYPASTQDVDLFPLNSIENGQNIVLALREIGFTINEEIEKDIIRGKDFIQIKTGPFDLDLVFAPDGIESFEKARERMIKIENFPIANLRDIIASKKASGREKDFADLPLLEDFRIEFEKKFKKRAENGVRNSIGKIK